MLSELGRRPMLVANKGTLGDKIEKEIGVLFHEQHQWEADYLERELSLYRSGSAPPTVEGSLSAVGGLLSSGGNSAVPDLTGARNQHGFASEEELRSDPAYLSYYYMNVNLNPRLPPPLISKEDWRSAQRLKGGSSLSGNGDRKNMKRVGGNNGRSLFSMPPGFDSSKQDSSKQDLVVASDKKSGMTEWGGDKLLGFPTLGLGSKPKSHAEVFQDDLSHVSSIIGVPSRHASRNAFDQNIKVLSHSVSEMTKVYCEPTISDALGFSATAGDLSAIESNGPPSSFSYAAAIGSALSRSNDPQLIARVSSPCILPIGAGRVSFTEKKGIVNTRSYTNLSSLVDKSADMVVDLSGMKLSSKGVLEDNKSLVESEIEDDGDSHQNDLFGLGHQGQVKQNFSAENSKSRRLPTLSMPQSAETPLLDLHKSNVVGATAISNSLKDVDQYQSAFLPMNPDLEGSHISPLNGGAQYQHVDGRTFTSPSFGFSGYSANPAFASMMPGQQGIGNLPSALGALGLDSGILAGGSASLQNLASTATDFHDLVGSPIQAFLDPVYLPYLRTSDYAAAQLAAMSSPPLDKNYLGTSYMNLVDLQKAYLGAHLPSQKLQYAALLDNKSSGPNHHCYVGNPTFGFGLSYLGSPMASPTFSNSPIGSVSPIRNFDLNSRYTSGMRNLTGGVMGPWNLDVVYNTNESFRSSLLDEFKSSKTKYFELSEIAGHVVEFSSDQYGSGFIQQKLETATNDEKNMVYQEIMPQALALMTDVFGNYVIQKFFEHGLPSQRRELADKLLSHVLTLSLQMYGCRVIQKAIEVVDVAQKIKMVQELDGHIMRCVRDQNGNHVIQKCIECVPEEEIHFIVSTFTDQVVTLSTHPYGCRVIQRTLEHCKDPLTQGKVMEEILGAVSMLAQDQYGNYVVQHVLEHGKQHERSAIIKELAGQIGRMSQQKFASNVVEKCLTFGGPAERQLLVNEMLGTTDENEPLQAMMKDQFANYVVQKVLESCEDQQRELILSRIKVHLNALRKYTYGKHIVARVEKLVAAGERRTSAQSIHHPA